MSAFYALCAIVVVVLGYVILTIQREEREQAERKREDGLTIHKFACLVAKKEGKKKQVNIAQIKEILKVVNDLVDGELYNLIKTGQRPNAKKGKCC